MSVRVRAASRRPHAIIEGSQSACGGRSHTPSAPPAGSRGSTRARIEPESGPAAHRLHSGQRRDRRHRPRLRRPAWRDRPEWTAKPRPRVRTEDEQDDDDAQRGGESEAGRKSGPTPDGHRRILAALFSWRNAHAACPDPNPERVTPAPGAWGDPSMTTPGWTSGDLCPGRWDSPCWGWPASVLRGASAELLRGAPGALPRYDAPALTRRSGGTGRRDGLKHRWGQPRPGSSPGFGTIRAPGSCRPASWRWIPLLPERQATSPPLLGFRRPLLPLPRRVPGVPATVGRVRNARGAHDDLRVYPRAPLSL
jgi:hypothetical protein